MARTVLVVDDDPLVLEVTADMLNDLGCDDVVTAASGTDAIERLSENANIELLITDLNMPGMDGYALARGATEARPGLEMAQSAFHHTAHHGLSTFGRQRRILVAVHRLSVER